MRVGGEDMSCALKEVRPSAMREVTIEVPKVHQTMGGKDCRARVSLVPRPSLRYTCVYRREGLGTRLS